MLKKLHLVFPFLFLSLAANANTASIEKKYPNAKYKISDDQVNALILKVNGGEKCIYPELKGLNYEQAEEKVYSKWSEAENQAWEFWQRTYVLPEIIGKKHTKTLLEDEGSFYIYSEKHDFLNHQEGSMSEAECKKFQKKFLAILLGVMAKSQ